MRYLTSQQLLYTLLYCALFCAGAYKFLASERRRFATTLFLIAVSAGLWYADQQLHLVWLWESSAALAEMALLQVGGVIVFNILLGRWKLPLILRDIALGIGYLGIVFAMLTRLGANVSGLVATSTVLTAVIGLSMQESLLNMVGGIVLQVEREISLGDYIRIENQGSGWVREFRNRYTAIETSDLDTILIPNNLLIRGTVTVVGKIHRRVIPFYVSYDYSPSVICETVQNALRATPVFGIAADPPPRCVVTKMHPDHIEYAAMVFQNRPGHSHTEISGVLTRVYYALARAGCPLVAVPRNMSVLQVNQYPHLPPESLLQRLAILRKNEIFGVLEEEDLAWLNEHFVRMPFAPGEFVVKQGDLGQSLYLVVKGVVRVSVQGADGRSERVAELGPGSIFGEMSLLTGEPRSASVIANEPVECDSLEKADFARILERKPEVAELISAVLARRQSGLKEAKERLETTGVEPRHDFLKRIQEFFRLGKKSA